MKFPTLFGRILTFVGLILLPYTLLASPVIQGPSVPAMYWKSVSGFSIFFTGGNVGIGIANPNYLLDVDGVANFLGIRMASGAVDGYVLTSDAIGNAYWGASGGGGGGGGTGWGLTGNAGTVAGTNFVGTTTAQDLVFKTNSDEKLRITSGGNVYGLGSDIPDGIYSFAIGSSAGSSMSGVFNVGIGGNAAGYSMAGIGNTGIGGQNAGFNSAGIYNISVGGSQIGDHMNGTTNTAVGGAFAGFYMSGSVNTAMGGTTAGYYMNGQRNTAVGGQYAGHLMAGYENTAMGGQYAGSYMSGSNNTAIGTYAGQYMSGSSNVYIGTYATGVANGSNQFSIGNVIYGTGMGTDGMANGRVGIGTQAPSEKFEVNGNVKAVAFYYTSDKRLKKNIIPLVDSLDKILALNGYSFDWINNGKGDIGVIAQEVEEVFPDLVKTDANTGLKSVEYANLVAPLIEALREVNAKNQEQDRLIEELQAEIHALKINLK